MKTHLGFLATSMLLAIAPSLSIAQALETTDYGACASPVHADLADGGLALRLTGIAPHEQPTLLTFLYADGLVGPAEYMSAKRAREHEQLIKEEHGWLVVGNRSVLAAVRRGELPQVIPDDSDPSRTTIWFGRVFGIGRDGSCLALWTFPGLAEEDFSPSIWARLQATLQPAATDRGATWPR